MTAKKKKKGVRGNPNQPEFVFAELSGIANEFSREVRLAHEQFCMNLAKLTAKCAQMPATHSSEQQERMAPKEKIEAARNQLNDVVRRIAKLKKIRFNEAWHLVWGRLYNATGFDALGVALSRGLQCPLDAIQECRRLKDALKAAGTLVDGSA